MLTWKVITTLIIAMVACFALGYALCYSYQYAYMCAAAFREATNKPGGQRYFMMSDWVFWPALITGLALTMTFYMCVVGGCLLLLLFAVVAFFIRLREACNTVAAELKAV